MKKKSWKESSTYQILFGSSIVPAYIPLYYRIYLLLIKGIRSMSNRRRAKVASVLESSDERLNPQDTALRLGDQTLPLINKTSTQIDLDLAKKDTQFFVNELNQLQLSLDAKGLKTTTAAGTFKAKDTNALKEKNKLWENVWVLASTRPKNNDRILDIGGASTLFSFYLASLGCEVHSIDNDWGVYGLIYNARYVTAAMKWRLRAYNRDVSQPLPFKDNYFDKIYSICVLEHLTSPVRRFLMQEVARVLKPNGMVGLTFDYVLGREDPRFDKGLRFGLPKKLLEDIILPSQLTVYGNQTLTDDCPPQSFLGTLFLKKSG